MEQNHGSDQNQKSILSSYVGVESKWYTRCNISRRSETKLSRIRVNQAAYQSRIALLYRLSEWYIKEMDEIVKAFDRAKQNKYGLGLVCHNPLRNIGWISFPRQPSAAPARKRGKAYIGFEDLFYDLEVAERRSAEWIPTCSDRLTGSNTKFLPSKPTYLVVGLLLDQV
jgi:hypothetical protein